MSKLGGTCGATCEQEYMGRGVGVVLEGGSGRQQNIAHVDGDLLVTLGGTKRWPELPSGFVSPVVPADPGSKERDERVRARIGRIGDQIMGGGMGLGETTAEEMGPPVVPL